MKTRDVHQISLKTPLFSTYEHSVQGDLASIAVFDTLLDRPLGKGRDGRYYDLGKLSHLTSGVADGLVDRCRNGLPSSGLQ